MRYLGGKGTRVAPHIVPIMLSDKGDRTNYLEPFVGGGGVFERMAPHFETRLASDADADVILLWRAVRDGWAAPTEMTRDEWARLKGSPEPSALRSFAGFGCSYGASWFNGFAVQSEAEVKSGAATACNTSARSLERSRALIQGADYWCCDYRTWNPGPETVVYCDPPYVGTMAYKVGDFDTAAFWRTMAYWGGALGAQVYVSERTPPTSGYWSVMWHKATQSGLDTSNRTRRKDEFLFKYEPPA